MRENIDINQQIDLIINSKRVNIVAIIKAQEDACPFLVEIEEPKEKDEKKM